MLARCGFFWFRSLPAPPAPVRSRMRWRSSSRATLPALWIRWNCWSEAIPLGRLLMEERGRRREAIRSFEIAVLYRPDYADARFRLAGHYFSEGNWAEAEVHYRALSGL